MPSHRDERDSPSSGPLNMPGTFVRQDPFRFASPDAPPFAGRLVFSGMSRTVSYPSPWRALAPLVPFR